MNSGKPIPGTYITPKGTCRGVGPPIKTSVPAGTLVPWAGSAPPTGWKLVDYGQTRMIQKL